MKEKISKEKILEYFEKESGNRLLDRVEYAERVIFPAMEQYARQFLNPIVADNVFELIGQGVYKINCCELTIGGLADQVEQLVNLEVEKRIAERMVSDEERHIAASEYEHKESMGYSEMDKLTGLYRNIDFEAGADWACFRLTNPGVNDSQKTEGGGE